MPNEIGNISSDKPSELDILNSVDKEIPDKKVKSLDSEETNEDDDSDSKGDDSEEEEESDDSEPDGEGDEGESEDESDEDEDVDEEETEEEDTKEEDKIDTDLSVYKRLKSINPEIFKKVPELRDIIFREQKYTELLPTVEEAQATVERVNVFNKMEEDILAGKPDEFVKSIQAADKDAFATFADNFLPAIAKLDKDVYASMMELPIKRAFQHIYVQAKKAGNENLMNAALHMDRFYFGEAGIGKDPEGKKKPEKTPEMTKFEKEKEEHNERLANNFNTSLIEVIDAKLNREIGDAISKYDFDSYKRKNVSRDINNEVNQMLASDKRYQAGARSLYQQAKSAGFSGDWKARIQSAYLARARAILPLAKKKVIDEALGKKSMGDKKVVKRLTPSNSSGRIPTKLDASKIDRSKTSEMDILSGDDSRIHYKK